VGIEPWWVPLQGTGALLLLTLPSLPPTLPVI
jgi:hypothetical protein